MKLTVAIMTTLALAIFCGCQTSPRGGSVVKHKGFTITAPTFSTEIKQGDLKTIAISLQRDSLFKQDVELQIKASKGISIEPSSLTVKASDKPEVLLQIAAPKDAPIGEYPVVVKGTPDDGEPTSVGFTVKVVAP